MKALSAFLVILLVSTLPSLTYAQSGLVPCGGPSQSSCQFCHFVTLTQNIFLWLVEVMTIIYILVLVVSGIWMALSTGDVGTLSTIKKWIRRTTVGFIILLAAWTFTDLAVKFLVGSGAYAKTGPWSTVACVAQPTAAAGPALPPPSPLPPGVNCADDAGLMATYNGSPVGAMHPQLATMINCYRADANVASLLDTAQIYTVDQTYPRCALTNGNGICGGCSHSYNSCHYGRGTGLGAMAVDFNSTGSELQLYTYIQARQAACGGTLLFETNHTHISLGACP